jgi:hypothetical protein
MNVSLSIQAFARVKAHSDCARVNAVQEIHYLQCKLRAWTRLKIEQCSIFPALTRVDARSVSAEYVSHVFELGIDARNLNEP